MIDPTRITNYKRSQQELQEFLLFCIAVAGKRADTTARNLQRFLDECHAIALRGCPAELRVTHFNAIRHTSGIYDLKPLLKKHGFGCQKTKSRGFEEAARSSLNLWDCSARDLEMLHGIKYKTSRYFILHSRLNARVACLDTHVLRWLAYYTGRSDVPQHTPSSKKKYEYWEKFFLGIADAMGVSPADLDLRIWNKERGSDEKLLVKASRAKEVKSVDNRVRKKRHILSAATSDSDR